MENKLQNDLFSSLISHIKTYAGKDPLLPWLRGIRKMKESLPPQLLEAKLPRFLQKCAQTFKNDRRYRNDMRYVRVWIQLMDFVDDPRVILRSMEMNRIGMKRALFYQAYALYYEKLKRFEDAEKMYHLGVQNLAEPANGLQKSYELFLHRMELYKKKRMQEGRIAMRPLNSKGISQYSRKNEENKENIWKAEGRSEGNFLETGDCKNIEPTEVKEESYKDMVVDKLDLAANPASDSLENVVNFCDFGIAGDPSLKGVMDTVRSKNSSKQREEIDSALDEPKPFCNEDTVVVKFVDTAIVGKSETEDACHHGLVDPTINMKEAMNAINSMFCEPIEMELGRRQPRRTQSKVQQNVGFEVFIDENLDNMVGLLDQRKENGVVLAGLDLSLPSNLKLLSQSSSELQQPHQETFEVFVDDDDVNDGVDHFAEAQHLSEHSNSSAPFIKTFIFPCPKDLPPNDSDDLEGESSLSTKLREDTVVCRFVGSTILDGPQVENACHHGLVDPTINLKEAMDDINSMFGKPLDFIKPNRLKKREKSSDRKGNSSGFSILSDEVFENQDKQVASSSNGILSSECDLFEPTVFTKEAMDEINEMFGMPLDF